jgi:peptide methionine sulfoxide reductase MsrB
MKIEETQKQFKALLSKGASEEEMLKELSLSEGCGLKVWCQEQVFGSDKKFHRWCGYVTRCDDPSENITEPEYGAWIEGGCPGKE